MQARLATLITALLIIILASGCAHGSKGRWRPEYKVRKDVFPNGLTVLFVEDHTAPVVSYTTWFKVGSAWERPGATGIAHLFEHMMFKGTPKFSAQAFFKNLESKGAVVNAYTQRDATVYYEVIASKYLELVIEMEADRLANLAMTQADLDSERQVVKEERRLRVDSNFGAQHLEHMLKLAFPTHPYGWPTIGYQEDLDRLSLAECQQFFKTYYQPGNAIVTIAGDFDYKQARAWIEKYYGSIKGHDVPELKLERYRPPGREQRDVIFRPVEAESILIAYYIPSMYSEDAEKLSMLAWALFGMSSSRANLSLVREKQVALNVGAEAALERHPHLFVVSADLKTGQKAEDVEREIYGLIDQAKTSPLTDQELERVKNGLIYSTVNEGKSPSGVASWLASGEFYWGDYNKTFEKLEKYHSITTRDLVEVAKRYLVPENRVVVLMKPEKKK